MTTLPTPEQIKKYIADRLSCEHIEIGGDGQHFFATIISHAFTDKSRLQRHQLVYQALGDRMQGEIHAISMKTMTPVEWEAAGKPS